MLADMVDRGLGMRNATAAGAAGMVGAYSRMLRRYPPDACQAVCRKLWGDWMPSCDVMETEIRSLVAYRVDMLEALDGAELLTPEQIEAARVRYFGINLCIALDPFPFWETGRDSTRERWGVAKLKLQSALLDYCELDNANDEFDAQVTEAEDFLSTPLIRYPYGPLTEAEREEVAQREKDELAAYQQQTIEKLNE